VKPIFDPFTVKPAPGTRQWFHAQSVRRQLYIPRPRWDSVTGRLIQAYPLPDTSALAANQVTNPVLGQSWDQGDIRVDYNLSLNTTIFGRFSQQDTLTLPPSTFGLRLIPGLDTPVGLGNSTTYAGNNNLVAHHAVLAATHVFSPTFIVDAAIRIRPLQSTRLKRRLRAGRQFGRQIRNQKLQPRTILIRTPDLRAF